MKFNVKFQREFEIQINASDLAAAEARAHGVLAQFPSETCKLLSIVTAERVPSDTRIKKRHKAVKVG